MSDTKILANEIKAKWSKLNPSDLTQVKGHDALSTLVAKAYNLGKVKPPTLNGATPSTLSPASYRVLRRLEKGCAYKVHGAWRARGLHSPVSEPTLLSLLARGLAERIEFDRFAQIRITATGRSACEKIPRDNQRGRNIPEFNAPS
jgi:hypothetical protein